jgi:hypothetical protein
MCAAATTVCSQKHPSWSDCRSSSMRSERSSKFTSNSGLGSHLAPAVRACEKTVGVPLHAVKMASGPRLASEFEGLRTLSLRHSERPLITELGSALKGSCQWQQQLVMVQGGRKKESLAVSEGRNSVSVRR